MNKPFSDFLARLIDEGGQGKNSIIRNTGINRSSFYKFLNGERIPTKIQYEEIKRNLPLTVSETQKLDKLYNIATLGMDITSNRKAVYDCLEMVSAYEGREHSIEVERTEAEEKAVTTFTADHKNDVLVLLDSFLERQFASGGRIDAFMPYMDGWFYQRLHINILKGNANSMEIRNLIQFPKGRGGTISHIVENYNNMLFFALSGFQGLQNYYYYDNSVIEDNPGYLYPYYLLGSDEAIFVDGTINYALLIRQKDLLTQFRNQVTNVFAKVHKSGLRTIDLPSLVADAEDYSQYGANGWRYGNMADLLMLLDEDQFRMIPDLEPYVSRLRKVQQRINQKQNSTEFISLDGIRTFAKDGIARGLPITAEYTFSPKDRIRILKKIYDAIGLSFYILDEKKMPILREWVFIVIEGKELFFVHCGKPELMEINELNLVDIFADYFGALPMSDNVLSVEKSHEEIQKLISELNSEAE